MQLDAFLDEIFKDLRQIVKSANETVQEPRTNSRHSLRFESTRRKTPTQLSKDLGIDLGGSVIPPASLEQLLELTRLMVKNSVNTNSPLFLNRLFSGAELAGMVAEWFSVAMNTSAGAWDVSPVFSVMERETIRRFLLHAGYDKGCGVFCPGGSSGNLYAIHVAREKFIALGHRLDSLVAITSTQAHYSLDKSARVIGLSVDQVIKVEADSNGCIKVDAVAAALKAAKDNGKVPFFLHLTSGTTVMGAFDDIEACVNVSAPFGTWVHVDGSWGGAVLLSDKRKHLMKGIEKSDSLAWCAHKMIGAPLHASVILFRDNDALRAGFDCDTPYIYQNDRNLPSEAAQLDTFGKYTFQCSRPVDSAKVWMIWRHLGSEGLQDKVEHAFNMASQLVSLIQSGKYPNFRLVHLNPQFTNVCFWFLPDSMLDDYDREFEVKSGSLFGPKKSNHPVGEITSVVRAEMLAQGVLLMGYSTLTAYGMPYFFRFVAVGRQLSVEHLHLALEHLRDIGNKKFPERK